MFSATMPPAVERLARKYLRNPVVVSFEDYLFIYFEYICLDPVVVATMYLMYKVCIYCCVIITI